MHMLLGLAALKGGKRAGGFQGRAESLEHVVCGSRLALGTAATVGTVPLAAPGCGSSCPVRAAVGEGERSLAKPWMGRQWWGQPRSACGLGWLVAPHPGSRAPRSHCWAVGRRDARTTRSHSRGIWHLPGSRGSCTEGSRGTCGGEAVPGALHPPPRPCPEVGQAPSSSCPSCGSSPVCQDPCVQPQAALCMALGAPGLPWPH